MSIVLVGGGGHCVSCIDAVESTGTLMVAGFVDPKTSPDNVLGYLRLGDDSDLPALVAEHGQALVTLGQVLPRSAVRRQALFDLLVELGADLPTVVASTGMVSRHARVAAGTVVLHGAVVNAGAHVGVNTILNSQSLVEHDAVVGDHCHISTGAMINGAATVGDRTFVGSGAVVREGIAIGTDCVIQAGSVVLSDVPDGTVYRMGARNG